MRHLKLFIFLKLFIKFIKDINQFGSLHVHPWHTPDSPCPSSSTFVQLLIKYYKSQVMEKKLPHSWVCNDYNYVSLITDLDHKKYSCCKIVME